MSQFFEAGIEELGRMRGKEEVGEAGKKEERKRGRMEGNPLADINDTI